MICCCCSDQKLCHVLFSTVGVVLCGSVGPMSRHTLSLPHWLLLLELLPTAVTAVASLGPRSQTVTSVRSYSTISDGLDTVADR